jgi:hypothetical protein
MTIRTSIRAGVIGAIVMTLIMRLARVSEALPANLEMMLGTMIGLPVGALAWTVGLVIHLGAGAVFGLIYAWCFEHFAHRAGWGTGLGIGAFHTIISGFFLAAIPPLHPLIPEQMPAPGVFMANLGALGVMAFALLHLIFGAILGSSYGPVAHRRPAASELPAHGQPHHSH